MPKKGVPWKRPVFFLARRKVIKRPFRKKSNFQRTSAFWEASPTKNPIFTEDFWKGLEKSKKQQRRTTHVDSSEQHFFCSFFGKAPFPGRARAEKRTSEKLGVITGPRKAATKHYENQYFWTIKTPGPIIERTAAPLSNPWIPKSGPIIKPMNPKIRPHYRSLQHGYIYIYIYGCSLNSWAGSGQQIQKIPSFIVKKRGTHTHTYIYICCKVKKWSNFCPF